MKSSAPIGHKWSYGVVIGFSVLASLALLSPQKARTEKQTVSLAQHIPAAIKSSQMLGRANANEKIQLALTLPLKNTEDLDTFLRRVYDRHDPIYGQYLTSEEFTANHAPTEEEYNEVIAFAKAHGLEISNVAPNRILLGVSGSVATIEKAFGVHINRYQARNGRKFYANDANPILPANLQGKVSGIVGLDNFAVRRAHNIQRPNNAFNGFGVKPHGSGPGGGLTPKDITTAYGLKGVAANGAGQTIALFELDGYTASDVTNYLNFFNLPKVPLKNILVDGFNGSAGGGAGEVTLDIELQIAIAPGVSSVLVYEGPNSGPGVLDTYNKIATDNTAKQISTSWGLDEGSNSTSELNAENNIFKQMAAQGQSIYAASGDAGAFDDGSAISVDDPASQPFMTAVGGTTLSIAKDGTYISEKTWGDPNVPWGGGGGISVIWPIPSYQAGVISAGSKGSTTKRNVPDVSLDADPNTGYAIFFGGGWQTFGGTSCASPLWAGYTAIVNQQRAAANLQPLGFANPALYSIGKGANYLADFHDIADGSTNLFYPAVKGFDDATGWGSFIGGKLLSDLSGSNSVPTPANLKATAGNASVSLIWSAAKGATGYNVYRSVSAGNEALYASVTKTSFTDNAVVPGVTYFYRVTATISPSESNFSNEVSTTPTGTVAAQLIGNPGFESGSKSDPWLVTAGVIDNSSGEPAHSGKWKAWLCGYGMAHTDTLAQTVTIPASAQAAALSFWLHVDSAEPITTGVKDTLTIQIRDGSGAVLNTIATFSNTNAAGGYSLKVFDMQAYVGKTIQIYFAGVENSSKPTSFVVDDFTLNTK